MPENHPVTASITASEESEHRVVHILSISLQIVWNQAFSQKLRKSLGLSKRVKNIKTSEEGSGAGGLHIASNLTQFMPVQISFFGQVDVWLAMGLSGTFQYMPIRLTLKNDFRSFLCCVTMTPMVYRTSCPSCIT